MSDNMSEQGGERVNDIFGRIAIDYMKEKKRKRRWGIFFKSLFAFFILCLVLQSNFLDGDGDIEHAAFIDLQGGIYEKSRASSDNLSKALRKAYKDSGTTAVVLRINSPGGSPVQADYMYNEIMHYRQKHPKIKVYAVCSDICASAAYFVASAADEIYADPASLVGSIGVIYNGFGFVGAMQKLGIERRLLTAGEYKGLLDPFSPENETEKSYIKTMLDIIHKEFEYSVEKGRGDRLQIEKNTFSGLFWTGKQAKKMGLIDDFGSATEVVRNVVKSKHVINYTVKKNIFDRFTRQLGDAVASKVLLQLGMGNAPISSELR